jgi:regulator of replication initiation timing
MQTIDEKFLDDSVTFLHEQRSTINATSNELSQLHSSHESLLSKIASLELQCEHLRKSIDAIRKRLRSERDALEACSKGLAKIIRDAEDPIDPFVGAPVVRNLLDCLSLGHLTPSQRKSLRDNITNFSRSRSVMTDRWDRKYFLTSSVAGFQSFDDEPAIKSTNVMIWCQEGKARRGQGKPCYIDTEGMMIFSSDNDSGTRITLNILGCTIPCIMSHMTKPSSWKAPENVVVLIPCEETENVTNNPTDSIRDASSDSCEEPHLPSKLPIGPENENRQISGGGPEAGLSSLEHHVGDADAAVDVISERLQSPNIHYPGDGTSDTHSKTEPSRSVPVTPSKPVDCATNPIPGTPVKKHRTLSRVTIKMTAPESTSSDDKDADTGNTKPSSPLEDKIKKEKQGGMQHQCPMGSKTTKYPSHSFLPPFPTLEPNENANKRLFSRQCLCGTVFHPDQFQSDE